MIITAFNPDTEQLEKTFLNQSYSAGTASIQVKNNTQVTNNSRLLIGDLGLAKSEIVTASSPAADGMTVPVGATLFSHEANTSIYILLFDQVKFYRSTTGLNGTYSLIATVNLDVTSEDKQTTYNDTGAQAGYYYKVSMFNSVSLLESSQSDPIPATLGWNPMQVGYVIEQFYNEIGDFTEAEIGRQELFGYFQSVNNLLTTNAARPYRFLYTRAVYDRAAASNTLALPTDSNGNQAVWKFDRLDYRYLDATVTPSTDTTTTVKMYPLEYWRNLHPSNENDANTQNNQLQDAALNDATNSINYYPYSSTTSTYGCFYLYYWSYFKQITTEGQYFQTWTAEIYLKYALMRYYRKKAIGLPEYLPLADRYATDFQNEVARYKSHDRRDRGTAMAFQREDAVTHTYRR